MAAGHLLGKETNASPAKEKSIAIANADFQKVSSNGTTVEAWRWWSRDKKGSAQHVANQGCKTPGAAQITHDGDQDFAFTNATRITVTPGESFKVLAWVKPIQGNVELAVVARSGKKTITWRAGRDNTNDADRGKWTALTARTIVPEGCDTIYIRFTGQGNVEALLDDVAIELWDWKESNKPKVQGFAKKRSEEKLDRGLVSRRTDKEHVYLSWRLLKSDPKDIAFNVYVRQASGTKPQRISKALRVNRSPIKTTTDFTATIPTKLQVKADNLAWSICPIINGKELAKIEPTWTSKNLIKPDQPIVLPLRGKGTFQKVGIADLDGDGSLDYVLKRPGSNIDPYGPYWKASPGTIKLDAYRNDGTPLWTHDLGWSIEQGIWYSPYLVYDFDGDGRAEVVAKTGVGDPRDEDGRVRSGEEFVTMFDGLTGKPLAKAPWPSREGFVGKDGGYSYFSRNQLGIAYLDGKTPCLIVARGTYNLMKVVAYQFHQNKLEELWRWDNQEMPGSYWGQGAHWMHGADVDNDGRDEIILGSVTLDDNGTPLWTTGLGHPDHCYVGDLNPTRPGLEVYYGIETRQKKNGMCMVDAATGKIIWGYDKPTTHIHNSGLCTDIDAAHPGAECYSGERDTKEDRWLRNAKGQVLKHPCDLGGLAPRSVYWDADPQRELIRGGSVLNYPDGVCGKIGGRFVQTADILGDWREEIITSVNGEMRIYMTTTPAKDRRPCLMQDPIYRIDVAHGAMGYTQVPTLSYDMASEAK